MIDRPIRGFGVRLPSVGAKTVSIVRESPDMSKLNPEIRLPLRREDLALAMQDVYDFFFEVNSQLHAKGIRRFDDMLRPASDPT